MVLPIIDFEKIKESNEKKLKNINELIDQKHQLVNVMISKGKSEIVVCANGECNHETMAYSTCKMDIDEDNQKLNMLKQDNQFDICFHGILILSYIQDINFLEQLKKEIEDNIKQLEDLA